MEEWDRIIKDKELWIHPEEKRAQVEEPWKVIFRKIEGRDPTPEQEEDAYK